MFFTKNEARSKIDEQVMLGYYKDILCLYQVDRLFTGWYKISLGRSIADQLEDFRKDFDEKITIVNSIDDILRNATKKQLETAYSNRREEKEKNCPLKPSLRLVGFTNELHLCDARYTLPVAMVYLPEDNQITETHLGSIHHFSFKSDALDEIWRHMALGLSKIVD